MRWFIVGLVTLIWILCATVHLLSVTPSVQTYNTPDQIAAEVKNVTDNCQDKQFTVYVATPNLRDLRDGEIILVASGTYNAVIYRVGQDIYKVVPSCITVTR